MRLPTICFYCCVLLMAIAPVYTVDASQPISLHPENPHYFLYHGKPTILVTSGEHYGLLLNSEFDYGRYFDELKSHGLNHTRVFSGVYRENQGAFGITDNPLSPAPERYVCPWARSDQPGSVNGGNRFDLTRWNTAWVDRLRDLMTEAERRDIVVELTMFCPMYNEELWKINPMNAANNVNGVGSCPSNELYALKHRGLTDIQVAFAEMVVQELQEYDNLYYEVCNEPYFGGVTMDWQHKIVDVIEQTQKDFRKKHLISLNIANGRKKIEDPHPAVSIFNFHYCVPPNAVTMNYDLNKVIGENETGFRGSADVLYRTEAWDFLLAGGALVNNLDYSFTAKHPDGSLREYKSPGGGSVELRQQLGILKRFLTQFNFVAMTPDSSVIKKVSPKLSAQALVQLGHAYAIYLHVPLQDKPKKLSSILRDQIQAHVTIELPSGSYTAEWVNTKTGAVAKTETFTHAGRSKQLASPVFSNDVAIRIVRD